MFDPFKNYFLQFSPNDGTIDFYLRVNALADPTRTYLDYGAGRGSWFEDDVVDVRRSLRHMKGKFAEVIAADIDPVVFENKSVDRCVLIEGSRAPIDDESIDVIVADYVMEHISDTDNFASEVFRILKPGGWFCARTPHKANYVVLSQKIIPNLLEGTFLHKSQPRRNSIDVFPKLYRLNTISAITEAFPNWENRSFCRRSDPAYFFGSRNIYRVLDFFHRVLPAQFSGNVFVFMQKPRE